MNKTTIEWADMTWNPVTGCKHGCPYCYARKIAERFKGSKAWPRGFEPMLHHERLFDSGLLSEKPKTVFVCSMADLFGEWVSDQWINFVMKSSMFPSNNTYIFLTKNPARYLMFPGTYFLSNFWFGATITGSSDIHRISLLKQIPRGHKFISFEPLLGDIPEIDIAGIEQVIIGAQTNPDRCVSLEAVLKICEAADRAGAKVFMKDSLSGRWPDWKLRRELCWSVNK
jgi:protein gp37